MAEMTTEFNVADATGVRLLETNNLWTGDVIYWLDASSAANVEQMSRIAYPLDLIITQKPAAIKLLNTAGKTIFLSTQIQTLAVGDSTDIQCQHSAVAPFVIAGIVSDNRGRFNPAAFSLTLGGGAGALVKLFPSPAAVRVAAGGAIQGHVAFANNNTPLVWGLLTLTVKLGGGDSLSFQGQTDSKGDFMIALPGLPPLPLNLAYYDAELSIQGLANSVSAPVNIVDLLPLRVESIYVNNDFNNIVSLAICPGEIKRVSSFNKNFIAVRAA